MKQDYELLAPAGNLEIFKAVIRAGCDAVYFGGQMFGARSFARNFTMEEADEAVSFAHMHGKKAFLTLNTLLKNKEIEEQLYEYLLPYYESGIDAVIVQDFGVLQFIKRNFPDLPLHASTQMSISSIHGARFMQEHGVERIVTARELSLDEIKRIHDEVPIEIETFIHGALCYCFSGQCLLSSMLGGRSGNRGKCAQPCRLPYDTLNADHQKLSRGDEQYPLSLKDLCTIDHLPELAEAGITSFKIEGRMKQAEYASGVVAIYRKYLDHYLEYGKENYRVSEEDVRHLLSLGNRSGFTDGYLNQRNGRNMITMDAPSHTRQAEAGTLAEEQKPKEEKMSVQVSVRAVIGEPLTVDVSCNGFACSVSGNLVQTAGTRPVEQKGIEEKVNKTGNTPFQVGQCQILLDEHSFFPMSELNELRRNAFAGLLDEMTRSKRRIIKEQPEIHNQELEQVLAPDKTWLGYAITEIPDLTASVETPEQLAAVMKSEYIKGIYIDTFLLSDLIAGNQWSLIQEKAKKSDKKLIISLPAVMRESTINKLEKMNLKYGSDLFMVRNFDALEYLLKRGTDPRQIRLDHSLYNYSDYSRNSFKLETGVFHHTLPMELNRQELKHRDFSQGELVIYGHIPLMTTAQCLHRTLKSCDHKEELLYLKDRYQKEFPVKNHCSVCYNTIYNAIPLCLFSEFGVIRGMKPESVRLSFTIEKEADVLRVLDLFERIYYKNEEISVSSVLKDFTFGHWKRGVE